MRDLSKLSVLLLIAGGLWFAAAVVFFVLYFSKSGMLPPVLPIGTLAVGTAFVAAFFRFRRLAGVQKPGKDKGKRK